MKKKRLCLLVLVMLLMALVACAPKAAPVAAPTPAALREVPAVPSPAGPVISLEDAAWQEVMAAAKREGVVTVYTYWSVDIQLKLQQRFKEKYGIKLEFIVGRAAEELQRLLAEKRMGTMLADVFATSSPAVIQAQKNDLTTSLADLPVLKEKDVWVLRPDTDSPDKQFLYITYQAIASAMNTKLLSPAEAPRSFKDLITPAWKGRMMMVSPNVTINMYLKFIPLLRLGIVDMDFIKALGKQDISFQISDDMAFQALARGERPFHLNAVNSVMVQYVAQGAPIKPVVLEEGTIANLGPAMAVIKRAPHPNAAKLFANWLMSREGQDVYAQALSFNSIRKDVPDYTPPAAQFTAKKLISNTLEDQDQAGKMFIDKVFPKLWEEK